MIVGARRWAAIILAALSCLPCLAQFTAPYVGLTGTLGSSNGMPASNYVISLTPSQVMYVGGTMIVVQSTNCGTDSNGAVIGTPNPLRPAILSANPGTGTLPAANYYVEVTWYDAAGHQTLPSPEVAVQLVSSGNISVSPPAGGAPNSAVGMNVYIGTSSGGETYQGHVTNPASTYTQSVALVTGAALPILNNTVCVVVANDAAWPIGGYSFNLTTPAGNTVPGFPQMVQFVGPGSAFNLSNGIPQWNGRAIYPVPILTLPYNHNAQSIAGPLSMTGYNIYSVGRLGVGTALPAWGVDVEGSGTGAAINANQGYLINGAGGSSGQAPCSDGTYIDQFCTFVTTLPTIYYQTIQNGSTAGTAVTQRGVLGLGANSGLVATDHVGAGPDVTRTLLLLNPFGGTGVLSTDPYPVMTAGGGVPGQFACWDATSAGLASSAAPCASGLRAISTTGVFTTCTMVGHSSTDISCVGTQAWSPAVVGTYYPICFLYNAAFVGGADTTGMTRAVMGITSLTSGSVSYWTSSLQGGTAGNNTQAYCVAFQ